MHGIKDWHQYGSRNKADRTPDIKKPLPAHCLAQKLYCMIIVCFQVLASFVHRVAKVRRPIHVCMCVLVCVCVCVEYTFLSPSLTHSHLLSLSPFPLALPLSLPKSHGPNTTVSPSGTIPDIK